MKYYSDHVTICVHITVIDLCGFRFRSLSWMLVAVALNAVLVFLLHLLQAAELYRSKGSCSLPWP